MIEYSRDNLVQLKAIGSAFPTAMKAFEDLSSLAFTDGAITRKQKELIAVAVAIAKECPYCIDIHARSAREAGASDQELAEAAFIAAAIGAGAAMTLSTHAFA